MCVCVCVGDLFGLIAWCVRVPFVFRLRNGECRAAVIRCRQNGDHRGGSVDGQHGTTLVCRLLFVQRRFRQGTCQAKSSSWQSPDGW